MMPMKDPAADAEKAKKAIFWLYVAMAIGVVLPVVLFLIFS